MKHQCPEKTEFPQDILSLTPTQRVLYTRQPNVNAPGETAFHTMNSEDFQPKFAQNPAENSQRIAQILSLF